MGALDEMEASLGLRDADDAPTPVVPANPFEDESVLRTCYHQPPFEGTQSKLTPVMDEWYNPKHRAVGILTAPLCRLGTVTDEVVAERGAPDNVDPYLVVAAFMPEMPGHLPSWFPNRCQGRELSPPEMLAWFDELLKHYADGWPLNGNPGAKQRQLVQALLKMYVGLTDEGLPRPSWVREKE